MQGMRIWKARVAGISGMDLPDESIADGFLQAILKSAEHQNSLSGLSRGSDNAIACRDHCGMFFGGTANDLFVAIATPHSVPAMNEKVKKLLPLCLFHLVTSPTAAASDALTKPLPPPQTQQVNTTFEVYCVEGGVDMLKNGDYTLITEFVVAALTSHQQQSAPLVSPHEALAAKYFKFPPLKVDGKKRYFAMLAENWKTLSTRYVDCRYGKCRLDDNSTIFNRTLKSTWADPNVVVLIGGESGSGKTLEMLCGHRDKADLVVYMRFAPELLPQKYAEDVLDILANMDREMRNRTFLELAAKVVQSVVESSCPLMAGLLQQHQGEKTFTVRLCFDEMGSSPAFVRACCAIDVTALRDQLNWGCSVQIFVAAAGTGIGRVSNTGGDSESKNYHLAMITDTATPDKAPVYWTMRNYLLDLHKAATRPENVRLTGLQLNVTALKDDWFDRSKRDDNLQRRSATLFGLFTAHAENIKAQAVKDRKEEETAKANIQYRGRNKQSLSARGVVRCC